MPTYLYECSVHGEFEEEHSIKIKLEKCPKCKEEKLKPIQKVKRLLYPTSGKVTLTGQELIRKTREDGKKLGQEALKSDKIAANLMGETRFHKRQLEIDQFKKEIKKS